MCPVRMLGSPATYHVPGADVRVVTEVLHERVVVRGEERAAADLRELRQHRAGDRRAVVRRCAATYTSHAVTSRHVTHDSTKSTQFA